MLGVWLHRLFSPTFPVVSSPLNLGFCLDKPNFLLIESIILNPTFMNNSGICIRELIEYFKIDAEDVIVFHDDLDVEFGKIKAKFGGSSAGHNGIASIDKFIGKDYSRVRIGIGKPKENMEVGDFVLQNFDEEELTGIEKISNHINESISILVEKKLDLFSSKVNNNN